MVLGTPVLGFVVEPWPGLGQRLKLQFGGNLLVDDDGICCWQGRNWQPGSWASHTAHLMKAISPSGWHGKCCPGG